MRLLLCLVIVLAPHVRLAHATEGKILDKDPLAVADDAELYRCKKHGKNALIKVTLKPETSLPDLVTWAMGFTCKTFVYGAGVRSQKLTVVSPSEMSPADAYRLFLTSLWSMGLTVVPKGKAFEIVESSKARESSLPVYGIGKQVPEQETMVRVVIRPTHLSSTDLAAVLTALKSQHGELVDVAAAGVLIVTDSGTSIARMLELAAELDVKRRGRVFRIHVEHADAEELAAKVTDILGGPKVATFKLIADARTSSLIVAGSEADYLDALAVARALDVQVGDGEENVHVVRLKNGDAEELAGILTGMISGGAAAAPVKGQPTTAARVPSSGSGTVRVTAAKSLNALVVTASDRDYRALRQVIRELDVRRRQVLVEATILEVSADRARDVGFAFHGGKTVDLGGGSTVIGGVQHPKLGTLSAEQAQSAMTGLAGGILGPEISLLGVTIPSIGALFQLVQSTSDVNLRSTPHLLTSDNQEAEIAIGQNIPYKSTLDAASSTTSFVQAPRIEREKLELKLKVTPHIGDDGDVRLDIELEIKDLADEDFRGLGPTWTTRTVKTTITVKDQQPIVIGGLIADRELESVSEVPFLADIPFLGVLFRHRSRTVQKRNLLIFLVPYVVGDDRDAQVIFDRKMTERREFVETHTAFQNWRYQPRVDYRKKRGLIAEIDSQVRASEDESAILQVPKTPPAPDGPIDP